jgi:hypothetical protein
LENLQVVLGFLYDARYSIVQFCHSLFGKAHLLPNYYCHYSASVRRLTVYIGETYGTRTIAPYQLITQYRAFFLRHEPRRFGRILSAEEAERHWEKYHDVSSIITDEILFEQLFIGY